MKIPQKSYTVQVMRLCSSAVLLKTEEAGCEDVWGDENGGMCFFWPPVPDFRILKGFIILRDFNIKGY